MGKWMVPSGGALLLIAVAAGRWNLGAQPAAHRPIPKAPPPRETERIPVRRPTEEEPPASGVPETASLVERESPWLAFRRTIDHLSRARDRMGEGGYRKAVMETTARFLEFDAATAEAFDATREVVRAELERLQLASGREFASYPVDLSDQELQRIQADIEERYREDRRTALGRMDVFLGECENHRQFRAYLESWTTEFSR